MFSYKMIDDSDNDDELNVIPFPGSPTGSANTKTKEQMLSRMLIERKCIITELIETEETYGHDLRLMLEEFYKPMQAAGFLSPDQLSAIFLNLNELLEINEALTKRMCAARDIAIEQGDHDLLTMNVGELFLNVAPMLHAFEIYCIQQSSSNLLVDKLTKEKKLMRIFLQESQKENTLLRRMDLKTFLMAPVQRVTKYPLLLDRLYNITPSHIHGRRVLRLALEIYEHHLSKMSRKPKATLNQLWRRFSTVKRNRQSGTKMTVDAFEWSQHAVHYALKGNLRYVNLMDADTNWLNARRIQLNRSHALLYRANQAMSEPLNFPPHKGICDASLLLVREIGGLYTLLHEPFYLDRCIVYWEANGNYFEIHEFSTQRTFLFRAENYVRTNYWCTRLQYHARGMGAWRKRRNALPNIILNGLRGNQK